MDAKELIFNMYKDEILISKKFKAKIIKKYGVSPVEAGDIFVRIQNYQVKKYGKKLDFNNGVMTNGEARYMHSKANSRKQQRKHKYWENKNAYQRTDY